MNWKVVCRSGLLIFFVSCTSVYADSFSFDDFSSLTTAPALSGVLTSGGFDVTFTGDNGEVFTDLNNGSLNALILGDNDPDFRTTLLTMSFNTPVTELILEFDAMHQSQNDRVTASIGTWTDFPASLSLTGQTLFSTAAVINPGGSGIDDDLITTLTFNSPVNSVSLSNIGAFAFDALTANAIPEPTSLSLLTLGGLLLRRRKA